MMSAIMKALDEIKREIDEEILELAFPQKYQGMYGIYESIDHRLLSQVVRPKVLVDCNLVGGVITNVSLVGLVPFRPDVESMVFIIPKDRTQNKSIMSVLSVGYLPYTSVHSANSPGQVIPNVNVGYGSELTSIAHRVFDSHRAVPATSTASVSLIAENTVLIKDPLRITSVYTLRCLLENDENLNNLSPRSWLTFSYLCVLATKAHIYRKLRRQLDRGYLEGGQELGVIKEIVMEYSDASEQYRTYLKEVWAEVAAHTDQETNERLIRIQISPSF